MFLQPPLLDTATLPSELQLDSIFQIGQQTRPLKLNTNFANGRNMQNNETCYIIAHYQSCLEQDLLQTNQDAFRTGLAREIELLEFVRGLNENSHTCYSSDGISLDFFKNRFTLRPIVDCCLTLNIHLTIIVRVTAFLGNSKLSVNTDATFSD